MAVPIVTANHITEHVIAYTYMYVYVHVCVHMKRDMAKDVVISIVQPFTLENKRSYQYNQVNIDQQDNPLWTISDASAWKG